jgi:hypothetical protein
MKFLMPGLYRLVLVQFFLCSMLFPQVKIKEKVELNKNNLITKSVLKSAGGNNVVSVSLAWDRQGGEGKIEFFEDNNAVFSSGWLGGSSVLLEKNYTTGHFPGIRLHLNLADSGPTNYTYVIK